EQHARTLAPAAARLGLQAAVLTGATARAERERLHAAFAAGRLALLVGTHALLDPGLRAADLGLVIVDEQHRFGVEQRARLGRGGGAPRVGRRAARAPGGGGGGGAAPAGRVGHADPAHAGARAARRSRRLRARRAAGRAPAARGGGVRRGRRAARGLPAP